MNRVVHMPLRAPGSSTARRPSSRTVRTLRLSPPPKATKKKHKGKENVVRTCQNVRTAHTLCVSHKESLYKTHILQQHSHVSTHISHSSPLGWAIGWYSPCLSDFASCFCLLLYFQSHSKPF